MAENDDAQPDAGGEDASQQEDRTLDERIDRELARRRAEKAQPGADGLADPALPEDAPQVQGEAADEAAPSAAADAQQPAEQGATQPDGETAGTVDASLQARIAEAMDERRAAKADSDGGSATGPPSALAEMIAKQREKLKQQAQGEATQETPEAEDPGAESPSGSQKLETMGEKSVSLQQVIGQQRGKLRQRKPGDGAEGDGSAQAGGAAGGDKGRQPAGPSGAADGKAGRDAAAPQAAAGSVVLAGPGRLSMTNVMLVANTFLLAVVGGVLLYVLSHGASRPPAADAAMKAIRLVEEGNQAPNRPPEPPQGAPDANEAPPSPVAAAIEAPTWAAAETAFAKRDYDTALDRYSRLLLAGRRLPSEALAADFYQLRIAQCMWRLGRLKEAKRILERLQHSDSPVVRAVCDAGLARMKEAAGLHFSARTLAYQALGALHALEHRLPLEADCDYLVARALSRKVNALHTTEQVIPWSRLTVTEVFSGRTEAEIRLLLEQGAPRPNDAAEPPPVRIQKNGSLWTLRSSKASLEDLLNQFASKTGKDLVWRGVPPAVRRRSLSFTLRGVSQQRACEVACGMAGLVAGFTWDQVVVHDPQTVSRLSDQKELLSEEATSTWRRFSLRYPADNRVPEGLFALGTLAEWSGDTVGALKRYQTLGRQYQRELVLAPRALMQSARLRIAHLRDYAGAQADLEDLLDLYPQYPQSDQVYLSLGRVHMQRGKPEEAIRIFLRVYSLNASPESRWAACLEAGACHRQLGEYEKASQWLGRCITSDERPGGADLVRAYLLLGRSEAAQGNRAAAVAAFRQALAAKPLRARHVEAVLALAEVQREADDFVGAMATLRRIEEEDLTDAQRYAYLMQLSKLHRAMGLPDRARALLRKRGSRLSDGQLRALIAVEQARCLLEAGDPRAARQGISEALAQLKSGPEAWRASLDLAEICMKMGDFEQAVVFALEVRRADCPDDTRRRALEMLGRCYLRQEKYEEAAEALAGLSRQQAAPATPQTQPGAKAGP